MKRRIARSRQEGIVLIMALVTLVLITLITVASVRGAAGEERMAGASRDRNKAFQAAEYALRTCLQPMLDRTYEDSPNPAPIDPAAHDQPQVWEVASNWAGSTSREIAVDTVEEHELAAQPRCLVERMGGSGSFRVTVRALGAQDSTAVILQATYSNE